MQAHLVQMDIAWEDPERNWAKVESLLAKARVEPGDLVVLPEMFDTGFSLNVDRTADEKGATAGFLSRLAEDLGVTVHGGRTIRPCHSAKAFNVATVYGPDGQGLAEFRKVHPFSFGREPEAFRGGDEVVLYPWVSGAERLSVCAAVCYDLRFPELFRLGAMRGAEVFALGANWPEARQGHWRALLLARAIENQAVVLGVNRVGTDPRLSYVGGSMAVGPKGEVLGELKAEERVLSVTIDPGAIRGWRAEFPALRDMRLLDRPAAD